MGEVEGIRPTEEPLADGRGNADSRADFLRLASLSLAAMDIGSREGRAAGAGDEALITTTGCGRTTAIAFR